MAGRTALFYIMRIPEFSLPGVSDLVYGNDMLVFAGTYSTTFFLVYFPLGILVPRLRPWAAVASIGFHVSIGFFMGLTGFALTMVACDLIFLSRPLGEALAFATRANTRIERSVRAWREGRTQQERPEEHAGNATAASAMENTG